MKALLIVDPQNDFMPGGSLAVPDGDQIIPFINNHRDYYEMVVWTKDWHPEKHCSFKENGGIWPRHCVQFTQGAWYHQKLDFRAGDYVVTKGKDKKFDSYSAFKDDGGTFTGLKELLDNKGIKEIDVCGLALEYCVKFTVMDALALGFKVNLITAGCRGLQEEDIQKALSEMEQAGATIR